MRRRGFGRLIGMGFQAMMIALWALPFLLSFAARATEPGALGTVHADKPLPRAEAARIAGDAVRTRFVLDLSDPVPVSAFLMADPYRVVIDLPEVAFALPADAGLSGRGLITGWRYGFFAPSRSRVVLDLSGPVAIAAAFVVPANKGAPARLAVDLVATDAARFEAELARTAHVREAANDIPLTKGDRLTRQARSGRPVVVIDPGHGGVDVGTTTAEGVTEKDIVLDFARLLKEELEAGDKVSVYMTREDDRFIPLAERVKIARTHAADLFVSIHADSIGKAFVRGATVYTLSERASDAEAAALALKENAADSVAGLHGEAETDMVSDILADLTRRETKVFSLAFANELVDSLSKTTKMIRNPHRSAGFIVLKAADVPSVLIEIGYLSNPEDRELIVSPAWRARMAQAIRDSIERFFSQKLASSAG